MTRALGETSPTMTAVTWLILPVVICLSQRLSHACLSTNFRHSEAANGSLGHPLFLGSYNPTWITVVILELIHASKLRPGSSAERARLLDQNQSVGRRKAAGRQPLVTLDNFERIARASTRRRIFQVCALSTFDGTRYAYHGRNG